MYTYISSYIMCVQIDYNYYYYKFTYSCSIIINLKTDMSMTAASTLHAAHNGLLILFRKIFRYKYLYNQHNICLHADFCDFHAFGIQLHEIKTRWEPQMVYVSLCAPLTKNTSNRNFFQCKYLACNQHLLARPVPIPYLILCVHYPLAQKIAYYTIKCFGTKKIWNRYYILIIQGQIPPHDLFFNV